MSDRALGYKTIGCFASVILVVVFFAYLLHFMQTFAHDNRRLVTGIPGPILQPTSFPVAAGGSAVFAEADLDAANMDRLPQLMAGVRQYAKAHHGVLPPMATPDALRTALFPEYVGSDAAFLSLRTGTPYVPNAAASGKPLATAAAAGLVLFYEPMPKGGIGESRAVMFASGLLRKLRASSFAAAPMQLAPEPAGAAKR